ncbi:MAG: hypothetical protein FK734_07175 [Asgard group archaeon]|nr:hypothetical protein [Asgard group archaeon]
MKNQIQKTTLLILFILIILPLVTPVSKITSNENDSFFNITIIYPNCGGPPCFQWVPPYAYNLEQIGIGINNLYSTHLIYYLDRIYGYLGPYPIPTYDQGGYDIFVFYTDNGFDWNPTYWFSTSNWLPYGYNVYQYSNPTFDSLTFAYDHTHNWSEKINYAIAMQELLYNDLPIIPVYHIMSGCYVSKNLSGFDLAAWYFEKQPINNWQMAGKEDIHIGSRFDLYSFPYTLDYFDDSCIFTQIYNGLLIRDYTNYTLIPYLVDSYSTEDLTWTFHLNPIAKWADGENLTADDIVFSYKSMFYPFRDPWSTKFQYNLLPYLNETSIKKIDNYTVEFTLFEEYYCPEEFFSYPIIPKHIFLPISEGGIGPEYSDWMNITAEWFETAPENLFGSGPYKVQSYNSTSNIIEMVKNPYFESILPFDAPFHDKIYFHYYDSTSTMVLAMNQSIIDFIDSRILPTWEEYTNDTILGANLLKFPTDSTVVIGINNLHPILGTGELCPIAGLESAYHVRKALSYMLNRTNIINTDWRIQGYGLSGASVMSPLGIGYNSQLVPDEYSLEQAKHEMILAGYEFKDIGSTSVVGLSIILILSILGFLGSIIILRKR